MNKTCIWLDDKRDPYENKEGLVPEIIIEKFDIIWIKTANEFFNYILKVINKTVKQPDIIFFDHDLSEDHYVPKEYWVDYNISKEYQLNNPSKNPTGEDCLSFLINNYKENNIKLPKCVVHSANPVGKNKILNKLINEII